MCRNSTSVRPAVSADPIVTSNNIVGLGGGMAELAVEHLSLRFGGLTVLEDVSFAAEPGELFARLGLARTFQHGELFAQMSVLENLLAGRHARISTHPLAEMLFLPSVRRAE